MYRKAHIAKMFNRIYTKRGKKYGTSKEHRTAILNFIEKNVPEDSTILDVGCGKGTLLRKLEERGYECSGTEICEKALFECKGLNVRKLFYEDLKTIESNAFDVVLSIECLPHLQRIKDVEKALEDLARIGRKYLIVSATAGHCRYPELNDKVKWNEMNFVDRPKDWWEKALSKFIDIIVVSDFKKSRLICGKLKKGYRGNKKRKKKKKEDVQVEKEEIKEQIKEKKEPAPKIKSAPALPVNPQDIDNFIEQYEKEKKEKNDQDNS